MSRYNHVASSRLAVAFATSLLLAAMQPARAGNHGAQFREFRQQNLGMDRHAARRLFRNEIRNNITPAAGEASSQSVFAPTRNHINHNHNLRPDNRNQILRNTVQLNDAGNVVRLRSGIDLDLTSNSRSIALGKNLFQGRDSIEITEGGETKTLTAGSLVSAAEYIAAKQVLAGEQKLTLSHGKATGGEVDLDAITGNHDIMRAANFVVSKDVTTVGDFSRRSEFKLLGDLNNYGTVLANASDANTRNGAIRADDINNFSGATINSTVDLTLDASGKINNAGTINSSAGLALSAGTALNNSGTISAKNDVSISSSQINNIRGTIASTAGNVNLDGTNDAALVINNQRGTITAVNGAINVRNASYNGAADTYLHGGDWLSKELNLNSGKATLSVNVNELTGVVNQTGTAAHLLANTANLTIGDVCLTGDPTFYNTAGGIVIQGTVTIGEELTVVAAGDIITATGTTIQAGDADTKGFDITLIAGAAIAADPANNTPTIGPGVPTTNGAVSLSGKASKTGGGVIFGANTTVSARALDTSGNTDGGDISIYAFGGKGVNAGRFSMDPAGGGPFNGALLTGGSGTGTNGNVLVIAGAKSDESITTSRIDTTGGTGTGGDVNLFTFGVASTDKKVPVTYGADGKLTSTSSLFVGKLTKGLINIRNSAATLDINAAGKVTVTAGNTLNIQGAVQSEDTANLNGISGIFNAGAAGPITSLTNVILSATKGDIGSVGGALSVDTPALSVFGGPNAFVQVFGTGALDAGRLQAKSVLTLRADGKDLTIGNTVSGGTVRLVANTFVSAEDIVAKTSLDLVQKSGDLVGAAFNAPIVTPVLNLVASTGKIGANGGSPFFIPAGVKTVSAVALTNGDINLQSNNDKALSFGTITGGIVNIFSNNSLSFTQKVTATALNTQIEKGTITVGADIIAVDTVDLSNQSSKGKIVVAKNTNIETNSATTGNINLTILPFTGPFFTDDIPNVKIAGNVTLIGSGLKGKAPDNFLEGLGGNIVVTNGAKAANISLGGNTHIRAD